MCFLYKKARMLLMIPIGSFLNWYVSLIPICFFNSVLESRGFQMQALSLIETEGEIHILHRLAGGSLKQIVYH